MTTITIDIAQIWAEHEAKTVIETRYEELINLLNEVK